jgi:hypothetical protein
LCLGWDTPIANGYAISCELDMKQVVIENPIINSPFSDARRHFRFNDDGITNETEESRRVSSYFIPIAQPKKKSANQFSFDTKWTQDRIEGNKFILQIRERVSQWRSLGYPDRTPVPLPLLSLFLISSGIGHLEKGICFWSRRSISQ